jgi:hypothetical protein
MAKMMAFFDFLKPKLETPNADSVVRTINYSTRYSVSTPVLYCDWRDGSNREHIYHDTHEICVSEMGDSVTIKFGECTEIGTSYKGEFTIHTDQKSKDIMICRGKERYDTYCRERLQRLGIDDHKRYLEYQKEKLIKKPYEDRLKKIIERCE